MSIVDNVEFKGRANKPGRPKRAIAPIPHVEPIILHEKGRANTRGARREAGNLQFRENILAVQGLQLILNSIRRKQGEYSRLTDGSDLKKTLGYEIRTLTLVAFRINTNLGEPIQDW